MMQMMDTDQGRLWFETEEQRQTLLEDARERAELTHKTNDAALRFLSGVDDNRAAWSNPAAVNAAKANLAAAIALPSPVESDYGRWQTLATAMRAAIADITTPLQALHHAQAQVPFDHRDSGPHRERWIEYYRSILCAEFPWYFSELERHCDEQMSQPNTLSLINGNRPVSNIFYWHMRSMLACLTYADKPKSIAEIGGGYGALARLWMLNDVFPIQRYVIFDIPESLFFSEVYLRTVFGDQVGYFMDGSQTDQCKIVLVPLARMNEYKRHIDLVISTGSMQEMSPPWVQKWMRWLDDTDARYFYSLNYMGQSCQQLFESRNHWAPCPSVQWSSIAVESDPVLPAMMSPSRYFCEIMFERKPPTVSLRKNWSVYNGAAFNRRTYIEGLELVRQHPHIDDIAAFLNISYSHLQKRYPHNPARMPKEMMYLAQCVVHSGQKSMQGMIDALSSEVMVQTL